MSNPDLIRQPKMRRSVQVGYRRLARPVVWPAIARASAPDEAPDTRPAARTFPWGMMERVRQALAEEPAPPASASRQPRERPAAATDVEPQIRRQVVVEETPARPRPAAVPAGLGDLPAATPDAGPDSSPFLQDQPEPEEERLSAAQAAPSDTGQTTPSDPSFAPAEVARPAWDDRSAPAYRQSPPQSEQAVPEPGQAVPEPVAGPQTPPAEAAPRSPSAAGSGSRASDAPHTTAVERAATQDAPAAAPAASDEQAAGPLGAASLSPAHPSGEQPRSGAAAPPSSAGGELPTQSPASREPESPPAAGPQFNLRSAHRDPWPAPPQAAQPVGAPSQTGEEPPSQAVPAAEAGSVQRSPEGRPEATPGDRTESASAPQAAPRTQSGPISQAQAQPEGTRLRRTNTPPPPQAEPGEGDAPTGGESKAPAPAPALTEAVVGVRPQPAEVGQGPAEVGREPVPPTKARQEPVSSTEARQEPAPPTEVMRMPVPPAEVTRVPLLPADVRLIQPSATPSAQPHLGTVRRAKRQTGGAPGGADEDETAAGPVPAGRAWGGGSAQATMFDAPAVIQTAQAADENTVPAAAPPPSVSSITADSAPPAAVDVDTLARQVYQILRRRLQVEYERNLGHGR